MRHFDSILTGAGQDAPSLAVELAQYVHGGTGLNTLRSTWRLLQTL